MFGFSKLLGSFCRTIFSEENWLRLRLSRGGSWGDGLSHNSGFFYFIPRTTTMTIQNTAATTRNPTPVNNMVFANPAFG
jgi:hypothetical protein